MHETHPLLTRIEAYRERHRQRHRAVRALAFFVGLLLLPIGVILIPLPGPGWLVVALALVIISLEVRWAAQASDYILRRLPRRKTQDGVSSTNTPSPPAATTETL